MVIGRALEYLLAKRTACDFSDMCTSLTLATGSRQVLEAQLNASPMIMRTRRGLYRHVWCSLALQLVEDCKHTLVCLSDWIACHGAGETNRQLAVYILQNKDVYKLHVHNNKYVRQRSVYNIHNRASLITMVAASGRKGVNAINVYQEYHNAHSDVHDLVKTGELFSLHDQLWSKSVIHALPEHLLGNSIFNVQMPPSINC